MSGWGRGWEVGVRKSIWRQEQVRKVAAILIEQEHGTKHQPGERPDLCQKCQDMRSEQAS